MCIVAFAWQVLDGLPLCLISNRDEFYHRPSSKLHVWSDSPVIAGQDLQSGGTWMGITKQGRWAIITNFRDGADQHSYVTSRGEVIQSFLESDLTPIRFAQQLELKQCDYAGFNLFVGDLEQAVYMSNRGEAPQVLAKGVYVVSNGLMSEDWQKTQHLRKRFTQEFLPMLQLSETYVSEKDIQTIVWDILEDERKVITELLPETGISSEMEALLSSTFIQSPIYGTRCSNFVRIGHEKINWVEKTQQGEYFGKLVHLEQKLLSQ
mgnify:FL=1